MSSYIKMNNGYNIPIFGLGTWLSKSGEIKEAIESAIDLGYRHFDCAWVYKNEKEIGETLQNVIKIGKVKREDLFITSKLWISFLRPEYVSIGFQETLDNLGLEYLDLYLIHWPMALKPGNTFPEKNKFKDEIDNVNLAETWKEMEKLVDSGKVKSIGVSNFNIRQLKHIIDNCRIKPAVHQFEVQIYFPNKKLVDFTQKNDIVVTAHSLLGRTGLNPTTPRQIIPLKDPEAVKIAQKLNATPAQILLSYILYRGIVCIPKSVSPTRLEENIKAMDIKLPKEDFEVLHNRNISYRTCNPPQFKLHDEYPFNED